MTTTITGRHLSPFGGTSYAGRAFDAMKANGSATFAASSFGQSSGSLGTFAFVFGSPVGYNTLTFNLVGGGTVPLIGGDFP